jgi:aminoglycoside 2'-N-acetyltransferase I
MRVRVRQREEYSPAELDELGRWLAEAFDEGPWRPQHWDDLGPGPHVVAESDGGELLAHACIAWVPITIGDTTVPSGYLEDVATRADLRGRGYGTAVVGAAAPLIADAAAMGFLATGSQPFYERLGWVRWRGSTAVREADGAITPTPEEDEFVMALWFPHTPTWISAERSIVRPRRDQEEAW